MDYFLLITGLILLIVGIIGCLAPVLPGPPAAFIGLLLLHFSKFADFSAAVLIILAIVVVAVSILDYIVPAWGTKKYGGSKYGTWGSTIGLIAGFFLGPFGIIIGPFLGAFTGEMLYKGDAKYALKAGWGSLVGFMAGVGLKLAACFLIAFYFFKEWLA